ncbi:class I SAM-dependent methyltransferase [Acetivibrio cellulolyticus]|uniref:class I SAM-dependent methyltransferase n=1 Tax=Acetivibrio cellulolyticus TaxID=35830 RepID=UPI0001E2E7A7|nr:class I SAM-dependent methyltransferase [Acetivibrio cellulolyticus]
MDSKQKMRGFRSPDIKVYHELQGYSKGQIYEGFIGCGGLYLVSKMLRLMNIKKGGIILDLGCGFGSAALFLAKKFDVTIIAVDLWNSPQMLVERANEEGFIQKIIPMQLDITKNIPFAENYFDAIFCMNSLFMFGGESDFLKRLFGTLKAGGTLCIGSECFNKEPDYEVIPEVYNFDWDWSVWDGCCSKYHSPEWWHSMIDSTGVIDIQYCEELDDGRILFEDFVMNYQDYVSKNIIDMGAVIPQERLAQQVQYGIEYGLCPTLYILKGVKK